MSIWDSVSRGARFGETLRQREQERQYGQAYGEGGLDAVAEAAGRRGDLAGHEGVRVAQRRQQQFDNEQQNGAFTRLQQFGQFAVPALRRAQQLPPEQRGQFLNSPHIRQRFEGFGFQPEQIDTAIANISNPETAEQTFQNLYAAFGGQGLDWSVLNPQTGEIGAIDPVSGQPVMSGGRVPVGYGREWRPASPEEMAQWGFRPGTTVDVNVSTGERRVRQAPPSAGRQASDPAPTLPPGFQWE